MTSVPPGMLKCVCGPSHYVEMTVGYIHDFFLFCFYIIGKGKNKIFALKVVQIQRC